MPVLANGDAVPAVPLVDQRGAPFDFAARKGETLIVAFIYTRCRDECPLVSAKLVRVQGELAGAPIHLVEMTVDPVHDTPTILARYGKLFGADPARWTLLTGKPETVLGLERRLGVDVAPGKDGEPVHGDELVFVGPDGRIADRLGGLDWSSGEVIARARTIAGLSANPFERVRLALLRGIDAVCGGGASGISLAAAILIFVACLGLFGFAASKAMLPGVRR